jgi:hypothetical protein
MRGLSLLGSVSVGLTALTSANAHVQPYFTPVAISPEALAADPSLANYKTWDLRVSVTSTPGSTKQDRFNVATLDSALNTGSFYSPVSGGDIPVIPNPANLAYDTYVTVPIFQPGMSPYLIQIPGSSDLLGPGSPIALFPRVGAQQSRLSVTWATDFSQSNLYNGDYAIARLTVTNDASGPVAGYVLSNDVLNLMHQNFAWLTFTNGMLRADPGSEFALLADANYDNQVNSADFTAVAQNFNKPNGDWSKGDFNGDGGTNAMDFNAVAKNFGLNTTQAFAMQSVVPEPASLSLLALSFIAARRRR